MSAADAVVESQLAAAVEELCVAAAPVAVVGRHAVAHLTVAGHCRAAHLGGGHEVELARCHGEAGPSYELVDEDGVVVAELVALGHCGVGVVQVVLHADVVVGIGSQGISVDVVEPVSSEHILHRLVVAAFVRAGHESEVPRLVLVNLHVERRREVQRQSVVVLGLDIVHHVAALCRHHAVRVDQLVEVDLAVALRTREVVVGRIEVVKALLRAVVLVALVPHVEIVAGHQLPVVGLRVVAVVVVQLRALILRVFA